MNARAKLWMWMLALAFCFFAGENVLFFVSCAGVILSCVECESEGNVRG